MEMSCSSLPKNRHRLGTGLTGTLTGVAEAHDKRFEADCQIVICRGDDILFAAEFRAENKFDHRGPEHGGCTGLENRST